MASEASDGLAAALQKRADGNLIGAWQDLAALARRHPDEGPVYFWYALTADNLGFESMAIPAYERALALSIPEAPAAHAYLASSLQKTWRVKEALPHIQQALGAEPDNPLFHVIAGNIHASLGHADQVETHYRRALALDPGLALAWHAYAQWAGYRGHLDEAERAFEQSWRLGHRGDRLQPAGSVR